MTEWMLPTAREWMQVPRCRLSPQTDLVDAIDQLISHQLSAAPVVDDAGNLLGLLTEKDCLRILSSITYDSGMDGVKVVDYQSPVKAVCEPEMDLFRVADLFLSNNFPDLPVIEDGRLIGVIARAGLLRAVQELRRRVQRANRSFEQVAGHQADRPRSIESMQRSAGSQTPEQMVRLFKR